MPLNSMLSFFGSRVTQAGYDHFGRIVLLQPTQNVEIDLVGVLAQLLHVAETGKRRTFFDGIETRRHLVDVLFADGLVEDACPAHL